MRSSLLVSMVFHVVALVALFWVRTTGTVVVPGPESVQVQLVDLGQLARPPRPAAEPVAEAPEAVLKPEPNETGVKLAPPPKPKKPTTPQTPAAPAPPEPQLPSAPAGNAGLRGEVSVDAANFEFTYYLLVLRNRVAAAWAPPAGLAPGGQEVRAVVFFRVTRGGQISEIRLERGSGASFFDQSAIRAITLANPMPPLPLGYPAPDLGVHFGFTYGG